MENVVGTSCMAGWRSKPEKSPANTGLSHVLSIGIEMEITNLKQSGGVSQVDAAKIVDLAAVRKTLQDSHL